MNFVRTLLLASLAFGCDGELVQLRDVSPDEGHHANGLGGMDGPDADSNPDAGTALPSDLPADPTDLPTWYEENRIQGLVGALPVTNLELVSGMQTPISFRTEKRREISTGFLNAAEEANRMGLSVFTRFVKNDWRGPLWPSAVPATDGDPNPVSGYPDNLRWMVEDAHSRGMHVGAYYWDGGEGRSSDSDAPEDLFAPYYDSTYDWVMPPNWLCRDLSGNPIKATDPGPAGGRTRGYLADFSSPFRGFTRTRISEMGERGVDIFYFDERHSPTADPIHIDGACFGSATEILYRATGAAMPTAKDWSDPAYRDYVAFQGHQLTNAFADWKGTLRRRGYEGLFVISGTYLSLFTLPYMDLGLAAVADSLKIEFLHGVRSFLADYAFSGSTAVATPPRDIGLALGWVMPRDSSDGRPPNLWFNGMRDAETVRAFVGTTLSYGAVANLHINDAYIRGIRSPLRPDATSYDDLREGIRFGRPVADVMAFARPYKYAAIHLSEHERNAVRTPANGTWSQQVWKEVMWPVTGAFAAFVRLGLPVTIVTDEQIAQGALDDFAVLYSPTPSSLPAVASHIEAFEMRGGRHVIHDRSLALSRPASSSAEIQRLTEALATTLGDAPLRAVIEGLPAGQNPHAVFHRRGETIVAAITNDFTFVSSADRIERGIDADLPPPPPVPGASVSIVSSCRPIAPRDALSGQPLNSVRVDGRYEIRGLPDFQEVALVTFEVDCE